MVNTCCMLLWIQREFYLFFEWCHWPFWINYSLQYISVGWVVYPAWVETVPTRVMEVCMIMRLARQDHRYQDNYVFKWLNNLWWFAWYIEPCTIRSVQSYSFKLEVSATWWQTCIFSATWWANIMYIEAHWWMPTVY